MADKAKPNDLILLEDNLPEHDLAPGRLGQVIEEIHTDTFRVKFIEGAGSKARTTHTLLKKSQFSLPYETASLTKDDFWDMIDQARVNGGGHWEPQYRLLEQHLTQLPIGDIVVFGDYEKHFRNYAYRGHLWAAAYVICGGCSDDGFMDFRDFLISRGKDVYLAAIEDPNTLLDVVQVIDGEYSVYGDAMAEGLYALHWNAYENKTGFEFPIFVRPWTNSPIHDANVHKEPTALEGMDWSEDTVYEMYPELTKKFSPYALKDDE